MSRSKGRSSGVVEHPTSAERKARGKEVRKVVPRSSFAGWKPDPDRPDPVEVLEQQSADRVPELVPLRYGRMLESPFTFYRGGAALMAGDLASSPHSGLTVQLCGDAHLSNFGIYASPDRRLVFSLNDFDETLPGPFEWDVQRLVASFVIAGRSRDFSEGERHSVSVDVVTSYRKAMRNFAKMRAMDVWYARLDMDSLVAQVDADATKAERKRFSRVLSKARSKNTLRAMKKLTHMVDGEPRFISDPPLVVPIHELAAHAEADRVSDVIHDMLRDYRSSLQDNRRHLLEGFRYVDLAHKVVGVGSVGTRAWIVLLMGKDDHDPLILQIKEAQASVLEPFLGPGASDNHGERVVSGQRMMQSTSDILLGWTSNERIDGTRRDFYMRQLWDGKGSARVDKMDPQRMSVYAQVCGWTLARAHARSGDSIGIASYLGSGNVFDRAMADFGESYAEQNESDYAQVHGAVDAGYIEAVFE